MKLWQSVIVLVLVGFAGWYFISIRQISVPPEFESLPNATVLTGKFVCLPLVNKVTEKECRQGFVSDAGYYYSIDAQFLETSDWSKVDTNTIYIIHGTFTPKEALSSLWWQEYTMEGIVSIISLKEK